MKVTSHKLFVCTTVAICFLLCIPHIVFAQKPHGVKTIVIDPGHGGKDAGCAWGKVYEKDIVLDVGLLLGQMIDKNLPDVKVVYTRNKDVFVGLAERGDLANKVGADLFVSIHVNSVDLKKGQTPPSGTETYVMGPDKAQQNLALAMRENDVITYEDGYNEKYQGYKPGSPESFIIFSLMQYANIEQSINMAKAIQKQYVKSSMTPDRGSKQANLLVLWRTTMPSVLTEIGFIVNEKERRMMTSKDGQRKIAASLFNAISEYKAKIEGNSNPIVFDTDYDDMAATVSSSATNTTSYERQESATSTNQSPARQGSVTTSDKWTFGNEKIVYRVQVYSVPKKLSLESRELRPFRGRVTERRVGNSYKYYVDSASTYDKALELQREVRKTVKDAFLVAFDGNKQITISEARKQTK